MSPFRCAVIALSAIPLAALANPLAAETQDLGTPADAGASADMIDIYLSHCFVELDASAPAHEDITVAISLDAEGAPQGPLTLLDPAPEAASLPQLRQFLRVEVSLLGCPPLPVDAPMTLHLATLGDTLSSTIVDVEADVPIEVAELPAGVPEAPAEVAGAPAEVAEVPAEVTEGAKVVAEVPVDEAAVVETAALEPDDVRDDIEGIVPLAQPPQTELTPELAEVATVVEPTLDEEVTAEPEAEIVEQVIASTEADEAALALNWSKRREIQNRLRLAGFSPGRADGVLGPRSRQAIIDWQADTGLPQSGFLNAAQLETLTEETAAEYAELVQTQRRAARSQSQVYRGRDGCLRRRANGRIVPFQSPGCDLRGLLEFR